MHSAIDLEEFQNLPTEDVARLVREAGPKVCVFPINGTRRWFMLEYPEEAKTGSPEVYFQIAGQRHIELYKLFFDHGIDTLLTPIFGPDLLERGEEYRQIMVPALLWFVQNQSFLDLYDAYDVRVRVYGDARRYLQNTPYEPALDAYDEAAQRTLSHRSRRLFFGVCAHDATETVAEIAICFSREHGRQPDKREIVEAYYGEYIEPVDFFIGFDRPAAFDMPLVATGREDLYFTVSPSPYMDARTLRMILYDHLYARQMDEASYAMLSPDDRAWMRDFYYANTGSVMGVGVKRRGVWYPLSQVKAPTESSKRP
jgi:tuberculosinol/isotuberculosinol synthase